MSSISTLVLGASDKPERYSYKAVERLRAKGHAVQALGSREGSVADVPIQTDLQNLHQPIDTVSLYLSPRWQESYAEWLLALAPRRVLFNPGTENPKLAQRLQEKGIATENACTLVLLSTDQY